jgi:hypothetical protein
MLSSAIYGPVVRLSASLTYRGEYCTEIGAVFWLGSMYNNVLKIQKSHVILGHIYGKYVHVSTEIQESNSLHRQGEAAQEVSSLPI